MKREIIKAEFNRREIIFCCFSKEKDVIREKEMREANVIVVILKGKRGPIFVIYFFKDGVVEIFHGKNKKIGGDWVSLSNATLRSEGR